MVCAWSFACMYVCAPCVCLCPWRLEENPLKRELQTFVNCYVGARKWTQVLWNCLCPMYHLSRPLPPIFGNSITNLSIAGLKLNCVIALASNSQKSTSLCLLSAEIKSMYHHTWQQPHFVGGNTGSREKKSTQIQHNYVSCYSIAKQSYRSSHILWDPIKSLLHKFTLQDWLLPTSSHQKLPQRTRGHLRGPIIHH